jgi:aminomethyltransferase
VVLDSGGAEIGVVLTCVADLAIGRADDRIYSIASADKPDNFKPRGLCCGFVRVKSKLASGRIVELKDKRRKVKVEIVDDIRPDRTARRPIGKFI